MIELIVIALLYGLLELMCIVADLTHLRPRLPHLWKVRNIVGDIAMGFLLFVGLTIIEANDPGEQTWRITGLVALCGAYVVFRLLSGRPCPRTSSRG